MRIKLSPQVRDGSLVVSVNGDVLTINGVQYDFSPMGEGDVLPASAIDDEKITGDIKRVNGQIELTIILPITHDAPRAACFPEDIVTESANPVILPMEYKK